MEGKIQMSFGMYEDEHRRQKRTMLDEVERVIDFAN